MPNASTLENLYEEALAMFPYRLELSSDIQTTFTPDENGYIEGSGEFTFRAGHPLDEDLTPDGWIELRQDTSDEEPAITAIFGIARAGGWQNGRNLPETVAIQGCHDFETKSWELWLE